MKPGLCLQHLRFVPGLIIAVGLLSPMSAGAHTIRQKAGVYRDNNGLERSRVGLDGSLDFSLGGEQLTNTSYTLGVSRDTFKYDDLASNKYQSSVYESDTRTQDAASVAATQTWKKITDTRVVGAYTADARSRSRTLGVGASRWIAGETWQLSFDVSRTKSERPEFEIVDYDSEIVAAPTDATSTGTSFGVRNLSTPTTITIANVTEIRSSDRPVTRIGSLGVRQFVIPANGALHLTGTRAYNRGKLTTENTYGEVDAWQADVAWLQTLWRGASGRIAYRWYREDETTRAYADELVFGSDMVHLGLAQELPKVGVGSREVPLTVEMSGTRYATNSNVNAGSLEFGLSGKF